MATADNTELIDRFEEFYRNYYRNEIGELAQKYPSEQKSLFVDWQDLYRFDPDLAEDVRNQPEQLQEYAEEALRLYDLPVDVKLGQAHVRVTNLPETTGIRDIRADHRGQLISVQGIVRKATEVRPKVTDAAFECQRCGTLTRIPQTTGDFQEPHECQGCERQGPFRINFDQSEFIDAQKLRIQESPEGLRGGETPQSIDVNIEDDITGNVTAGDHVRVTGVLKLDQRESGNEKTPMFDTYMDGMTVEIEDEQFEEMDITDEDKKEIVELSNEPDIYEQMVGAIAPSIYGYEQEKLSMILQLFSGVSKDLPDGSRIRGDLHMLLIGDPGTGKCQKYDTKVTLPDGTSQQLGDIVESHLDDPVEIEDGVYQPTDFQIQTVGDDGKITTGTVTKVWKREVPETLYEVHTQSGRTVTVTPSHPLFVQSDLGLDTRRAEQLTAGDFVAVPGRLDGEWDDTLEATHRTVERPNANKLETPTELTERFSRLLGYIIAEGYVVDDESGRSVTVTNADEEIIDDVSDCFESLGLGYSVRTHHTRENADIVSCSSTELVSFLREIEPAILKRSAEQRVPDCLLRASIPNKRSFLRAYVDSEGTVSPKEREIVVASMSRELLDGIQTLLLCFGIETQIQPRQNGSYRLRISGTDFETYIQQIGFVTERKATASLIFGDTTENTNTGVVPGIGGELRQIRETLELTQSDCGIPRTTYQHYERGDRNPSRKSLSTVLAAFEDRILWLQDTKRKVQRGDWSDIADVRTELGLSQQQLADSMDVEQTAVSYYERNGVVPDGGRVESAKETVIRRIDDALAVTDDVLRLRTLVQSDISWDKIESIERLEPNDDWVYDLEVEGTHSYISNGIISHNSQMLSYIQNIAPRSVYTSGKGSSAAGLTAAAVRDDFGDGQQWTLEAGALVLADQGIAAVDELDKMAADDRSAMHEALEQQSYHPNSEILLADGRRVEIGEFVDERMDDNPGDVVDGVDCEILPADDAGVHTVDLDDNDVRKTSIDRVSRHEAPEEFVRVTFSNGRDVIVTPEHPMFADVGGDIRTVAAEDIEEGAYVPAPRKLPNSSTTVELDDEAHVGTEKDVSLPEELSLDLAEILGLLTAEGHSYAGSAHEIGFSNQDERLLARMGRLMDGVFGMESTDTTNEAGTVTKRWISTKLYRWFERNFPEVMHTARDKRIPSAVLGASEEAIRRFLVGAFAGDGGVESEAMSFSTASEGLAEDYADALSKIGVGSRIHHDSAEDAWKVYVMGDSTARFVERVVEPADDRYEEAVAFAERSEETARHHDVLPPTAAEELRSLRKLLGLSLTGRYRPNLDEAYGVQIETVEEELATLRERVVTVSEAIADAETLGELRTAVGWSGRQLADRLDGETTSAIHYAEDGGYDQQRRDELAIRAERAIEDALQESQHRIDSLEEKCELRYYEVTDIETVPNDGKYATDWVYDVTVEPTNTFVSQGVVLHNSISVSKAGINATLKSRCSLLGAANPKYGRFDQYEPIGEQIDLEPALISRFDLIFTVTDKPDEEKDRKLAQHILTTNYAGELHTHRQENATPDFSQEEVETVTEEVDPTIDPELLRKYIAYAKRNCFPTMTEEAKDEIESFYVDLRSKGQDEDAAVPVTARKIEALIRLAESSARVRLSDTVEQRDAERVIEIVRSSLQDIGVDPETGELDADVVETGTSKSQRDRIQNIRGIIADIQNEYDDGAPVDVVVERAEEVGIDESKAEHEIEKLKQQGEIYEPTHGNLRTT
ncbi:LAGLIDADG family homing endonuclease [Halapricum hydrolyticum]|uniref:DNA helicase n=1 Tax=Halapricum hydrolyticum TaxID=2979991 RepID=A0AAE3IET0_9EURY|nr:LAGLIDADG family homing endonuclease [Halapricum hydrolyticum]MCU4717875.1 MCM family protein [Halapricum hydrolyticum]MCU4727040.1 MCM family protein [Halapricum hydrolyticum]